MATRLCDAVVFFFQAEDGIRDVAVTGVQTCALPIYFVNIGVLVAAVALGVVVVMHPTAAWSAQAFYAIAGLAVLFGVLLIIPIGGADMPTVISILNSYAGLSAVAMGFVLDNKLLVTAGALDGSSGLILSIIM